MEYLNIHHYLSIFTSIYKLKKQLEVKENYTHICRYWKVQIVLEVRLIKLQNTQEPDRCDLCNLFREQIKRERCSISKQDGQKGTIFTLLPRHQSMILSDSWETEDNASVKIIPASKSGCRQRLPKTIPESSWEFRVM